MLSRLVESDCAKENPCLAFAIPSANENVDLDIRLWTNQNQRQKPFLFLDSSRTVEFTAYQVTTRPQVVTDSSLSVDLII
jgi:hypothetical protein